MDRHPETAITPYLAGDLPPGERVEVAAHLGRCPRCRETAAAFRALLDELALAPPAIVEGDRARYGVEVWQKLVARSRASAPARVTWRWRPVPLALAAALAGVLVFLAVHGVVREPRVAELATVEEAVLGQRFELVRQYPIIENLDLLEDLEVIRDLDRLADARQGSTSAPREG